MAVRSMRLVVEWAALLHRSEQNTASLRWLAATAPPHQMQERGGFAASSADLRSDSRRVELHDLEQNTRGSAALLPVTFMTNPHWSHARSTRPPFRA